ncbi:putative zinc finger in N-recognin-domain-containing protein [Lineolata rhizophorae]|uniref:Putative zinc finger in N-recognin-domain-containing protein n=1 Tax=Lineolata rhizophorae TaxID=578093 RepID=A0A6A6NTY6_9PEZI|nr:putative zinc finger in N-recognin-domain-containing protein [Lineolata rhizophorae]
MATAAPDPEAPQTAQDFIDSQLRLEADAREALPYRFDACTRPLGALRQSLFSCLTCNPPPRDPAGVCYACSIACHGEHALVELFSKRDFVCDCGTARLPPSAPCALRGGARSETPAPANRYNHNFANRFCGCGGDYDAHAETGTMFQCVGLGSADDGGCGEDWWHPECVLGLPRDGRRPRRAGGGDGDGDGDGDDEPPLPPGFPAEDDFDAFVCYRCVAAFPWIRRYAGSDGFLPPVYRAGPGDGDGAPAAAAAAAAAAPAARDAPLKRGPDRGSPDPRGRPGDGGSDGDGGAKRRRTGGPSPACRAPAGSADPSRPLSLFCKDGFRASFCRCADCFPPLARHPCLLEEEETYEPPMSDDGGGGGGSGADGASAGTGSLLDRGEAALSNVDRVRAIEGVMAYNHLKEKVKSFLAPFAESGRPVGAEDIKAYFEKLRGDADGVGAAAAAAGGAGSSGGGDGGGGGDDGAGRREQSGEFTSRPNRGRRSSAADGVPSSGY